MAGTALPQLCGFKFRRQAPVGRFIADFVCFDRKLVVELDGGQHAEQAEEDAERTSWFAKQGFRVLRFWNCEVVDDLDAVLEVIAAALRNTPPMQEGRPTDHPVPSPLVGEG